MPVLESALVSMQKIDYSGALFIGLFKVKLLMPDDTDILDAGLLPDAGLNESCLLEDAAMIAG